MKMRVARSIKSRKRGVFHLMYSEDLSFSVFRDESIQHKARINCSQVERIGAVRKPTGNDVALWQTNKCVRCVFRGCHFDGDNGGGRLCGARARAFTLCCRNVDGVMGVNLHFENK